MRRTTKAEPRPLWIVSTVLLLTVSFGSGCLWAPELSRLQEAIEDELPGARFESRVKLTLGPMTVGLARFVTSFVPDAYEANDYLHEIHRVQVAVYDVLALPASGLRLPRNLRQDLEDAGWQLAVQVRDPQDATWVLYREELDEDVPVIRDLYVVHFETDQLVLLRVEGFMDQLFAKVMANHGPEVDDLVSQGY